jgi:tetratricopeptide (TPR) repeat protein
VHIATESQDEARVELLLEEIAESDDAGERSALLLDLSELLDQRMGDPERALRCAQAALEETPQSTSAAARCIALLERLMRWNDLANFLSDRIEQARSSGDEQAPLARRLAELAEQRLGDPGRAIPAWRHVLSEQPSDREALSALARLLGDSGRLRERLTMLAALVDATESPRERSALHRELATGYQDLGKLEDAAEHLEWALADDSGAAADYRALAGIYLLLGRAHAAINAHVRRAELLRGSERALAYLEIAALYEGVRKDIGRAIDFCLEAEKAAPDSADAMRTLVRLYQQQGEHESAIAALERWAARAASDSSDRAAILARAGQAAHKNLDDPAEANRLYSAALDADGDCVAALRGLAGLCRDRGEIGRAARLTIDALASCDPEGERAAIAFEAGELHELLGDRAGAIAFYRDALDGDPGLVAATARLAELLWQEEHYSELIVLLEQLSVNESDLAVLKTRLARLCHSYRTLGLDRRAIGAVSRALEVAPEDQELRRLQADLYFQSKMWSDAARALEPLLAGAPTSTEDRVHLLYRAGVCAGKKGEPERACYWLGQALGLAPRHRESLLELLEHVGNRPKTRLDILRALEPEARGAERLEILVDIGDLLVDQLDRPDDALAAYNQALELAPNDHILAHKCLDLLAGEKRWQECREMFDRLIASESDPAVRAKYGHAAALLYLDELDRPEEALTLWWTALDDDPDCSQAREGLESLLRARSAWQALANLYCKHLAHLGRDRDDQEDPDIAAERLRLWIELGELCWSKLGQRDSALDAFEVACKLAPDDVERVRELAERAAEAGPAHRNRAIACHRELLARNKQRAGSYKALSALFTEARRERHAAACADAYAFAVVGDEAARPRPLATRLDLCNNALTGEMWNGLRHPEEDPLVSAVLALVAPAVAGANALSRKRLQLEMRSVSDLPPDSVAGRVLTRVVGALGMPRPFALACPESHLPVDVRMIADKAGARPALIIGGSLLSGATERTIAFHLGRALASLRGGGMLRWVLPRPEQIAHLLDATIELATGNTDPGQSGRFGTQPSGVIATVRSLERGLSAPQREQLVTLGTRLVERAVLTEAAAAAWLKAHDLSIARVGLVACGDLATSLEVLRGDARSSARHSSATRAVELIWSSVTEAVLEARAHLEDWTPSIIHPIVTRAFSARV